METFSIHTYSLSLSLSPCVLSKSEISYCLCVPLFAAEKNGCVCFCLLVTHDCLSLLPTQNNILFRSKQHTVPLYFRTVLSSPAGPRLFRLFSLAPSDCLLSVSLVFCLVSVSVYAFTAPKILGITGTGLGVLARACFRKAKYHTVFVFLCV